MKAPLRLSWLLVAIAVLMVLGHICAEPFHAHAGVVTTHEGPESHAGAPESSDAIHAASCDAVKAPSSPDAPLAVLVPVGAVPVLAALPVRQLVEAYAAIVVGSPPLFLLHAALLI